ARKAGDGVRLYSRHGNDLTKRFPLIVAAVAALRARTLWRSGGVRLAWHAELRAHLLSALRCRGVPTPSDLIESQRRRPAARAVGGAQGDALVRAAEDWRRHSV